MPARSLDKRRDTPELVGLIRNAPRRQKSFIDNVIVAAISTFVYVQVKSKFKSVKLTEKEDDKLTEFICDTVMKQYVNQVLN